MHYQALFVHTNLKSQVCGTCSVLVRRGIYKQQSLGWTEGSGWKKSQGHQHRQEWAGAYRLEFLGSKDCDCREQVKIQERLASYFTGYEWHSNLQNMVAKGGKLF